MVRTLMTIYIERWSAFINAGFICTVKLVINIYWPKF